MRWTGPIIELPLEKALGRIKPGEPVPGLGKNSADYTHILSPEQREAIGPHGRLVVFHNPESGHVRAQIHLDNGHLGGEAYGSMDMPMAGTRPFHMEYSEARDVPREWNGKRLYLGRAMYEALLAHAKNALHATHVVGGTHSTFAMKAHSALAEKHGMIYEPVPNVEGESVAHPMARDERWYNPYEDPEEWESEEPQSFDDRYAPYAYTLKAEAECTCVQPLEKSLSDIAPGPQLPDPKDVPEHFRDEVTVFDYDHMLTEQQRKLGYRLEVRQTKNKWQRNHILSGMIYHMAPGGDEYQVGNVTGIMRNKDVPVLEIHYGRVHPENRGHRVGMAAYEALLVHSLHNFNAQRVHGSVHSTSAQITHQALCNKYGLQFEGGEQYREPRAGGSFDEAFGSYGYALKSMVATVGTRLAKEEGDDPIMNLLRQDYAPSYEIKQALRMDGFTAEHMAELIRQQKFYNGAIQTIMWKHPLMTKDFFKENFLNPDGSIKDVKNVEQMLLGANYLESMDGSPARDWVQEDPGFMMDLYNKSIDYVKENKDNLVGANNRLDNLYGGMYRFAGATGTGRDTEATSEPPRFANPDVAAKIDMSGGIRGQDRRKVLVRHMARWIQNPGTPEEPEGHRTDQQGNPAEPAMGVVKHRLLDHFKDVCASLERMKTGRGARYYSQKGMFETIHPIVESMVKNGEVADSYIKKNTTKKGLFSAILAASPNFPKKKYQAILEHFKDPEKRKNLINFTREKMASALLSSPHMGDAEWRDVAASWADQLDPETIIKDPRADDELIQKMWEYSPSEDLATSLKNAGKLTPQLIDKLLAPRFTEEAMAKKAADEGNPYNLMGADIELAQREEALPSTVSKVFDHAVKGLDWEAANHPDNMTGYGRDGVISKVINILADSALASSTALTPDLTRKMADLLIKHPMNEPPERMIENMLNEDDIKHILTNSNNGAMVAHALSRQDAKPEWIDLLMARPEARLPAEQLETQHGLEYHTQRFNSPGPHEEESWRYRDPHNGRNTLKAFQKHIRTGILDSPGIREQDLDNFLKTTTDYNEVIKMVQNPRFGPAQKAWLLSRPSDFVEQFGDTAHSKAVGALVDAQKDRLSEDEWNGVAKLGLSQMTERGDSLLINRLSDPNRWPQVPTSALTTLYDGYIATNNEEKIKYVFAHPNADPNLLARFVEERPFSENVEDVYINALNNPKLSPELVAKMVSKVEAKHGVFAPENGHEDQYGTPGSFWHALAKSPSAPVNTLKIMRDRMMAHRPNNWTETSLGKKIQDSLMAHSPNDAHAEFSMVRVGGHKLRGIRDLVEQAVANGQGVSPTEPEVEVKKLPPGDYSKMRTKNPRKATVSSASVQANIDKIPAVRFNVSHGEWDGCQRHNNENSKVFQVNVTDDHVRQMKEAGVYNTFTKLQSYIGGHHPITPTTIGWVRWTGDPSTGSVHVDEVQCDHREALADMYARQYKDRPEEAKRIWEQKNAEYPVEHQKKITQILFGKVFPHEVLLETFHEWMRQNGHAAVKLHYPAIHFAGALGSRLDGYPRWNEGMTDEDRKKPENLPSKPAPAHYQETYEKMPKRMGYDLNSAQYGDEPSETDKHSYFKLPMHTSPVRKFEKAVSEIPDLPLEQAPRDSRIFDASELLSPEQRAMGYEMRVVTGSHPHGLFITSDVKHHGKFVGGVTGSLSDDYIISGDPNPRRDISFDLADIQDEHQGKGLGSAMYEAIISHAQKQHGATHVRGQAHSSLASAVHAKLAAKHGMGYKAEHNVPSKKYPTEETWARTPSAPYDTKYAPYVYTIKSEGPLVKALKGQPVPAPIKEGPGPGDPKMYDYSYFLPKAAQKDYKLTLVHTWNPEMNNTWHLSVHAHHIPTGRKVGEISAFHSPSHGHVGANDTFVERDHRNRGIGLAMYEALYSHGANALGATHAYGGQHSTSAHGVHQALAAKHGLNYAAAPNIGDIWTSDYPTQEKWDAAEPKSYDAQWGGYKYTIR